MTQVLRAYFLLWNQVNRKAEDDSGICAKYLSDVQLPITTRYLRTTAYVRSHFLSVSLKREGIDIQ